MFGIIRRSLKVLEHRYYFALRKEFFKIVMSTNLLRLESNTMQAETLLDAIKKELEEIKHLKINEEIALLEKENSILEQKVLTAKQHLIQLEVEHGIKQIGLPSEVILKDSVTSQNDIAVLITQEVKPIDTAQKDAPATTEEVKSINTAQKDASAVHEKNVKPQKEKKEKKDKQPPSNPETEAPIDVRRLDFRVGKIIEVSKHPDADSLYVEKIDCGEAQPRTVVSGLVNYVPIEEMNNRMVVVLCNLKPAKMRGITSEAMVMCASSPNSVEILSPPPGAVPGDLVHCDGYPREPDAQLNPKKKVFETCAPDLRTNDNKEACFKGTPLMVPSKGHITAKTLASTNVK